MPTRQLYKAASLLTAFLILLPILAIAAMALASSENLFEHLFETVLPAYALNTVLLVGGTMTLTLLFGIPTAWLTAMCRFPTSKWLEWLLVLPMAMPGYVVAYIYTGWFEFSGPVQSLLRDLTGWAAGDYWFPSIRSVGGAALILALVFYPYVYLTVRTAFLEQSANLIDSARLLGSNARDIALRVSLPLVRPAVVVGLSLVAMETIGDFGTVEYFAVNTLTTAVYDTWLGYSNIAAAARISSIMLLVIVLVLAAERLSRKKLYELRGRGERAGRYELVGTKKWAALFYCWTLVGAGFVLPFLQLLKFVSEHWDEAWNEEFGRYAANSFEVAVLSAAITLAVGLLLNFYRRLDDSRTSVTAMHLSSMGYAVPGTVLAIGVMIPLSAADHFLNWGFEILGLSGPGLWFSGSIFALVIANVVRFSCMPIGSLEASLGKISPSLDMAAQTMGTGPGRMFAKIHLPLIRRGILLSVILVFIESMKELNAAILLRPFDFETLATGVFNYASDEMLEVAAMPAILLVLAGLLSLILINRAMDKDA